LANVERGAHVGFIAGLALVPPAILCRKQRGDEDFVDWCPEVNVGVTAGKLACVLRERAWAIAILEIAQPIRNTKMAKVNDRTNLQPPELRQDVIGPIPVVLSGPEMCLIQRGAPA